MNRRAHWTTLTAAALAVALAAPLAIGAEETHLKLKAPSSVKSGAKFTLVAKGHAARKEKLRVFFDFSGKKCTAKAQGEEDRDTVLALFRDVGPGDFKKKRKGLSDSKVENARICGYLTPGEDASTQPDARAHRTIEFTKG